MLDSKELAETCGFTVANEACAHKVNGIFCGDLLSWAMGKISEGDIWCTVMGSINSVAVASLTDCACIVLCHGSVLMEDALIKAKEQGINIYLTELAEYEACRLIGDVLQVES